jgi:acyl phosphate:glycerol-3-phosphate acyltransferase
MNHILLPQPHSPASRSSPTDLSPDRDRPVPIHSQSHREWVGYLERHDVEAAPAAPQVPPAKLSFGMRLETLIIAVVSYLLGSIPVGYLLVRIFRKQDIRAIGSGNIGATNVLRSGGKGLGAATFLLDTLKGCSAIWLGAWLASILASGLASPTHIRNMEALAAICAVLGHMFPVWLKFKGGKGVATGFGVFLVASTWAALAAIGVFILVLLISRYVSLASILGAASFPLFAWLVAPDRPPFFIAAEFIVASLIIAKHHQNIRRLLNGTESRFGSRSGKPEKPEGATA